jgi:hypothetical protein
MKVAVIRGGADSAGPHIVEQCFSAMVGVLKNLFSLASDTPIHRVEVSLRLRDVVSAGRSPKPRAKIAASCGGLIQG